MAVTTTTFTNQLSLKGTKTEDTGSTISTQPLSVSEVIRLLSGSVGGQVDELSTLGGTVTGPTNEQQTVTIDADGGTWTIAFNGSAASGPLAFDITPAALQTALEALTTIAAGEVLVTGGVGAAGGGTPYQIEFQAGLGNADQPVLVTDPALLTGGAGTANVATIRQGSPGAVIDIDLQAVDDGFGSPSVFQTIVAIYSRNSNTGAGEVLQVGGPGPANPWQGWGTGPRIIYEGTPEGANVPVVPSIDFWLNGGSNAGAIVDGANKILRIESLKNPITFEVDILGRKV